MDARLVRTLLAVVALFLVAATHRTSNFVVEAPTAEIARQVGAYAEHYRAALAEAWLGKKLPNWYRPCSLNVNVGNLGAGGSTTFSFDRGEVFGWQMEVQGTLDRILVSVLPHEVSHTIFACHFRQPLPRWADEGAATLAEDADEQQRQTRMLQRRLSEGRCYSLRKLFGMREYPRDVLALYAQGFSVAKFLMQKKGEGTYLAYLGDALRGGWDKAVKKYYGYRDVEDLETHWIAWVESGSPDQESESPESIALEQLPLAQRPKPNIVFRGQAPDAQDEALSNRGSSLGKDSIALASASGAGWRPAGAGLARRDVRPPRLAATPDSETQASIDPPQPLLTPNREQALRFEPAGRKLPARGREIARASGANQRQPLFQRIAMPRSKIPAAGPVTEGGRASVPARRLAIGPAYRAQPYSFAPT